MAFVNIAIGRRGVPYNYKSYICDTESDISVLPTDVSAGSLAFVAANSKKFILNNQSQWIEDQSDSTHDGVSLADIATLDEVIGFIDDGL